MKHLARMHARAFLHSQTSTRNFGIFLSHIALYALRPIRLITNCLSPKEPRLLILRMVSVITGNMLIVKTGSNSSNNCKDSPRMIKIRIAVIIGVTVVVEIKVKTAIMVVIVRIILRY